jgi:chemotaxis protein CheX
MGAPKIEKQANPLHDKRFVNAFIEGVMKTISLMAQVELKTGKPKVEPCFNAKGEVAGIIGMVCGDMKGTMSISFHKEAILSVIENMTGDKHTEINDAVADAVGELTNQIYGNAKTTLNYMGYAFQMAIPTVIQGNFKISKLHNGATLEIPFELPNGAVFYVDITVS